MRRRHVICTAAAAAGSAQLAAEHKECWPVLPRAAIRRQAVSSSLQLAADQARSQPPSRQDVATAAVSGLALAALLVPYQQPAMATASTRPWGRPADGALQCRTVSVPVHDGLVTQRCQWLLACYQVDCLLLQKLK